MINLQNYDTEDLWDELRKREFSISFEIGEGKITFDKGSLPMIIKTPDLVSELKRRGEEICPVLDELSRPACVFVIPTSALVEELCQRTDETVDVERSADFLIRVYDGDGTKLEGAGPAKILVIREGE